jgi:sulfite exporter TauE/SafE
MAAPCGSGRPHIVLRESLALEMVADDPDVNYTLSMGLTGQAAEAFALGLTSGPVCIASCAPVLLPVLTVERRPARGTSLLLAQFLSGRLLGYLVFALIAWSLGHSLTLPPRARVWAVACSDAVIAALLAAYFAMRGKGFEKACRAGWARQAAPLFSRFASAFLGFASGLSLCPPFVAAGVRAAESAGLAGALLFFLWFFLGTSVWFAPSVSLAAVRRFAAVGAVARMMLFLLAAYYGYLAVIFLGRAYFNG